MGKSAQSVATGAPDQTATKAAKRGCRRGCRGREAGIPCAAARALTDAEFFHSC